MTSTSHYTCEHAARDARVYQVGLLTDILDRMHDPVAEPVDDDELASTIQLAVSGGDYALEQYAEWSHDADHLSTRDGHTPGAKLGHHLAG